MAPVDEKEKERRKVSRLGHRLKLKYSLSHGTSFGFVINESEHGLFLRTRRILKPQSSIIVWSEAGDMMAKGRVVWNKQELTMLSQETGGMGIHLTEVFPNYEQLLQRLRVIQSAAPSGMPNSGGIKSSQSRGGFGHPNADHLEAGPATNFAPVDESKKIDPIVFRALHELDQKAFSGLAIFTRLNEEWRVGMKNGRIEFVSNPHSLQDLIDELKGWGLIPYGEVDRVQTMQSSYQLLQLLLQHQWIPAQELFEKLRHYYQELLLELATHPSSKPQRLLQETEQRKVPSMGCDYSLWQCILNANTSELARFWTMLDLERETLLKGHIDRLPLQTPRMSKLVREASSPIRFQDLMAKVGGEYLNWSKELLIATVSQALTKI